MALPLSIFIGGAHTDVGKTHMACALIRAARARGLTCDAFKPVLSGFDPAHWKVSDAGRLLDALGRGEDGLDAVSPLRFAAPLAPPLAARREGARLELSEILVRCRAWLEVTSADLRLLEGVGGLMSPIGEDGLAIDLPEALGLPSVLVGGSYLGAVSHLLTALEVMRARHLPVVALVVSQDASPEAPDFAETVELVSAFAGATPVLSAPRVQERPWAEVLLDLLV